MKLTLAFDALALEDDAAGLLMAREKPLILQSGHDQKYYRFTAPDFLTLKAPSILCVEELDKDYSNAALKAQQSDGWTMKRAGHVIAYHLLYCPPVGMNLYHLGDAGPVSSF